MEFITPIKVKPCQTLVLLTKEEALVLLPDGNWARTPLNTFPPSLYKPRTNVPQYVQQFGRLSVARKDFEDELDLAAPPYRWRRKGGEDCDVHRN
jgi:hypothetical protein